MLRDGVEVERLVALVRRDLLADDDITALNTLYQGDVLAADRILGDLVSALRTRELLDRTLLVVTADHGQALGEHGRDGEIGHGFLLWQTVLHVPLLMRLPHVAARRIPDRVGLIDLAPTLLDLLGQEQLPNGDGRSLRPLVEGRAMPPARYFAEVRSQGDGGERVRTRLDRYAIYMGSAKVILDNGEARSYDLSKDPSERAPGDASLESGLFSQLLEDLVRFKEDDYDRTSAPLSEATREELRALGYLK